MVPARLLTALCFAAGLCLLISPAAADSNYTIIMQGNVVMPDGSPPPRIAGIERVCSDVQGSAPGPITNKKGHYLWSQQYNPLDQRVCYIQATLAGFISTRIDISNISLSNIKGGTNQMTLPDLVLSPRDSGEAGNVALIADSDVPGKVHTPYKAAVKALDAGNTDEGIRQLQLVVEAAPKFADGWNILGALYERKQMFMEARDALQHAIDINPKLPAPYLRLARVENRLGDFDNAAKAEDSLLKIEKRFYPEVYLQQAITRAQLKDYAGAEESAKTALDLDPKRVHAGRAEYVLGRIALAKGDTASAKEHIAAYMKMDPTAPDIEKIKVQLDNLGNPDSKVLDIPLERP